MSITKRLRFWRNRKPCKHYFIPFRWRGWERCRYCWKKRSKVPNRNQKWRTPENHKAGELMYAYWREYQKFYQDTDRIDTLEQWKERLKWR